MSDKKYDRVIKCEDKVFYNKSPLEFPRKAASDGPIYEFVTGRLYQMPDRVKNPLCWNHRCDVIWRDFWKLRGPVMGTSERTANMFWATVKTFLPEIKCFPLVEEVTLIKEVKTLTGKIEQHLWHWLEFTYELRGVGYNGRPPKPFMD